MANMFDNATSFNQPLYWVDKLKPTLNDDTYSKRLPTLDENYSEAHLKFVRSFPIFPH